MFSVFFLSSMRTHIRAMRNAMLHSGRNLPLLQQAGSQQGEGANSNFRRRIVMFLFSALFCEILSNIDTLPPSLEEMPESGCENQSVLRVYKRFMKERAHGDGLDQRAYDGPDTPPAAQ